MPIIIGPAGAAKLNDIYNDLVDGATDLTGAASAIAPAAVREVVCSAGGLASLLGGPLGPLQGPGSRDRLLSDLGGILQAACDIPPPAPDLFPTPGVPEPGQCLTAYIVTIETLERNRIDCSTRVGGTVVSLPGPVSGPTLAGPGQVVCGDGGVLPGRIDATFNNPPQTGNVYQPPGGGNWLIESITLWDRVRSDGLPDDCGEPGEDIPPVIPPIPELPESPVIPPAEPDPDLPGGGGFIFKPTVGPINVGPDGGISIPVVINVGGPSLSIPITIPVSVGLPSFSPTVIIGGSGGVSPPGGGGSVTAPRNPNPVCCRPRPIRGPEIDGEEGEPVEGEEPPFRGRLVGVVVTSVVNPELASFTEIGQGGGAKNLFVPRLGSLYFDVSTEGEGGAVAATTKDNPIKTLSQYIEAPQDVAISGFRAVPEQGVRMTVVPIAVLDNESGPAE